MGIYNYANNTTQSTCITSVEPLNKGHNRNNLSIKDTYRCSLSYSTNTFSTSKERQACQQSLWGPGQKFIVGPLPEGK